MADEQLNEETRKSTMLYLTNRIVTGGMIAINVIILQDLISLQKLDGYLHITAIAISIALPIQIGDFFLRDFLSHLGPPRRKANYKGIKTSPFARLFVQSIIYFAGIIVTLFGMANAFFHISPEAGRIFIITIAATLVFVIASMFMVSIIEEFKKAI